MQRYSFRNIFLVTDRKIIKKTQIIHVVVDKLTKQERTTVHTAFKQRRALFNCAIKETIAISPLEAEAANAFEGEGRKVIMTSKGCN